MYLCFDFYGSPCVTIVGNNGNERDICTLCLLPDEGSCEQDPVNRYTVTLYTFKCLRERQSRSVTFYIGLLWFLRMSGRMEDELKGPSKS